MLDLMIFKPHWFPQIRSLQSNEVETKRLITISRNSIHGVDGSLTSPERAITDHLHPTAWW